jgi:glycosyltransferase involved in cell wall biosynthesis
VNPPSSASRVAVVIAAYNSERFIDETLRSLTGQNFGEWVCKVVDDGSTDSTADRVEAFAGADRRISLLRSDHSGVSAARNLGLFSIDPDIPHVLFLDSDDTLLTDALETLVESLGRRPDAVGAYGLAERTNLEGQPLPGKEHSEMQRRRRVFSGPFRTRLLEPSEDSTFESLAVYGNIWPPGVALVRAPQARSVNGFLEGLPFLEDWDFFLRLARLGPFVHVDRQVAWYRRGPSEVTGPAVSEYCKSVAAVRSHVWDSPQTTAAQRRILRKAHRRQHASLVKQALESLHRPPPSSPAFGFAGRGLVLAAYAALVAVRGRPVPARGRLWRNAAHLDARYGGPIGTARRTR